MGARASVTFVSADAPADARGVKRQELALITASSFRQLGQLVPLDDDNLASFDAHQTRTLEIT